MLSFLPSLLFLEQFSPLLLRLTLGAILIYWGINILKNKKDQKTLAFGVLELVLGVLFVIGLFVQISALISAIIFIKLLVEKVMKKTFFTDGVNYYFILLIISLCLLVSGPGLFAFDLPL